MMGSFDGRLEDLYPRLFEIGRYTEAWHEPADAEKGVARERVGGSMRFDREGEDVTAKKDKVGLVLLRGLDGWRVNTTAVVRLNNRNGVVIWNGLAEDQPGLLKLWGQLRDKAASDKADLARDTHERLEDLLSKKEA